MMDISKVCVCFCTDFYVVCLVFVFARVCTSLLVCREGKELAATLM